MASITNAHVRSAGKPILAYGAVSILIAFAAYWAMFAAFYSYDDEGYFTYGFNLFAQGHTLYNGIFSQYGPFPYELWGGLFALLGRPLTPDTGRLIVWVMWIGTTLLLGLIAHRLTRRLWIGVITQVLSFITLKPFSFEPMHPGALVVTMVALVLATGVMLLRDRPRAALIVMGALTGAILLTKINAGAYVVVAVCFAAAIAIPTLHPVVRWGAAAALVLIAPAVMFPDLSMQWVQHYAGLVTASALALALVTFQPTPPTVRDRAQTSRWVTYLLGGFVGAILVTVGIVVILGSSLHAMYDSIIVNASRQRKIDEGPLSLSPDVVYWGLVSVAAAWCVRRLRAHPGRIKPTLIGGLTRLTAGLAIWFSIVGSDPVNLAPDSVGFALALPLAWIAALPSPRDEDHAATRFVRVLLPATAVLQALIAYPVPGSQIAYSSVFFLLCGAVCVADGWADLQAWSTAREAVDAVRRAPHLVMTSLTCALAVAFTVQYVERPAEIFHGAYNVNVSLPIAGATRLHLQPQTVSIFTQMRSILRGRCRSVLTMPGLLSINLWSGVPAPSGLTAEPWWSLMPLSDQSKALAAAQAAPGLCLVRNDTLIQFWQNGRPIPQTPLVRFAEQSFTPIAQLGDYRISVRAR